MWFKQGASRTKQYLYFFRGAPKNSNKKWIVYMHFVWIKANLTNELESVHYAFWKCYIQEVLDIEEGSDTTAFLTEHIMWQLWISDIFNENWADLDKLKGIFKINMINKINQETGFLTLSTLKLLHIGSSTEWVMFVLLSWST